MTTATPITSNSASAFASPCVSQCQLDPVTDYCFGCGRTRNEIAIWSSAPNATKIEILAQLSDRLSKIEKRPRRVTKRAAKQLEE